MVSPSSMNAECPIVGEHSTMNHHFAITSKRMNLVLSARVVANSSSVGMDCIVIKRAANPVSFQI